MKTTIAKSLSNLVFSHQELIRFKIFLYVVRFLYVLRFFLFYVLSFIRICFKICLYVLTFFVCFKIFRICFKILFMYFKMFHNLHF